MASPRPVSTVDWMFLRAGRRSHVAQPSLAKLGQTEKLRNPAHSIIMQAKAPIKLPQY